MIVAITFDVIYYWILSTDLERAILNISENRSKVKFLKQQNNFIDLEKTPQNPTLDPISPGRVSEQLMNYIFVIGASVRTKWCIVCHDLLCRHIRKYSQKKINTVKPYLISRLLILWASVIILKLNEFFDCHIDCHI